MMSLLAIAAHPQKLAFKVALPERQMAWCSPVRVPAGCWLEP